MKNDGVDYNLFKFAMYRNAEDLATKKIVLTMMILIYLQVPAEVRINRD